MLFEFLSTGTMLGITGIAFYQKQNSINETDKILKIADNCGLYKGDEHLRIYRRTRNKKLKFTEYVFMTPLGLSEKDFLDKYDNFKDGLNNKSVRKIDLKKFTELKYDKTLPKQIRDIFDYRQDLKKELEMDYDGMLRIRVFDHGMVNEFKYDNELLKKVSNWKVPIGITHKAFVYHDFEKMQILIVAGMTRYGKTVFLKNATTTLVHNEPDNFTATLIDLKGGLAFARYKDCKQVKALATNKDETLAVLEDIEVELKRRQELFLKNGWEDIGEANWKERHFVIIDEAAEIAGFDQVDRDRAYYLIGEIARIGAGLGFRLIFCTQYPTVDILPRQVKANTSAALCFKLKTSNQSMVVLDKTGAEKLPLGVPGRAIYQSDQERIVQTPFIRNAFIDDLIKPHIKINIKSKGEVKNEQQTNTEDEATGKYTTVFEEAGLFNKKPNTKNTRSKK